LAQAANGNGAFVARLVDRDQVILADTVNLRAERRVGRDTAGECYTASFIRWPDFPGQFDMQCNCVFSLELPGLIIGSDLVEQADNPIFANLYREADSEWAPAVVAILAWVPSHSMTWPSARLRWAGMPSCDGLLGGESLAMVESILKASSEK